MNPILRAKVYSGVCLAVLLLFLLGFYTYNANKKAILYSENVAKKNEVLFHIQQLLTIILDIETAQRGFAITADKSFLEPKERAQAMIGSHVQICEKLFISDSVQNSHLDSLKHYLRKKLLFAKSVENLVKQNRLEELDSLVGSSEGKIYMDTIRSIVGTMLNHEKSNLKHSIADYNKEVESFHKIFLSLLFSFAVIIIVLAIIINSSFIKLKEAKDNLNSLYNNASFGYINFNPQFLIVSVNSTIINWTGKELQNLVGKPYTSIIAENPQQKSLKDEILKKGWANGMEYNLSCSDGNIFPLLMNGVVLKNDKQEILQIKLTCFDNREAKLAEQKIVHLNEELLNSITSLETVNQELESFSYSVSHDLRAPLRSIVGYTTILKEEHSEKFDSEAGRLMDIVVKNAIRMGQLIDDLLSFSHIGKKNILKARVNMQQLVESILIEYNEDKNPLRSIVVGKLPTASADPGLIRQVWYNLISNAIKYSSKKEHPSIEIEGKTEAGMVIYSIKDNGDGFDMAYKHKLFGVFQRLHKQQEYEGTGVGLAIVKRIIERHGGSVWAEAETKKGAVFYFSLPIN